MCGIFGFYLKRQLNDNDVDMGKRATLMLSHRGPDNNGYWFDKSNGVFMGHTRLSVQDISDNSNQPYLDSNTRLVFNGEIYNFRDIRNNLQKQGVKFRTTGDTEVLAKSWSVYGVKALDMFDGMYAFAILQNKQLTLATDIFGEKPLYWCNTSEGFYFSSEAKPIVDLLNLRIKIGDYKKNQFLLLGYIPSPDTIYDGLYRSRPATLINVNGCGDIDVQNFWKKPEQFVGAGKVEKITEKELDVISDGILSSLSRRVISDVEKGVFLSAGVDSSLVAAMLSRELNEDFLALTVSYNKKYIHDESMYAADIARYLKVDHVVVDSEKISDDYTLSYLDQIYGEPNTGLTAFSIRQMARLSKEYFTVALSGTGGDEVFFGYDKHRFLYKYKNMLADDYTRYIKYALPVLSFLGIKKIETYKYLCSIEPEEILFALKHAPYYKDSHWNNQFSKFSKLYFPHMDKENRVIKIRDFDMYENMPNIILPSVDRGSMMEGVEVRTPFLSKELLNIVSSIDYRKFVAFGQKNVLRKILSRYLPKKLFDLPKMGFVFPEKKLLNNMGLDELVSGWEGNEKQYIMDKLHDDARWSKILLRYAILSYYSDFEKKNL